MPTTPNTTKDHVASGDGRKQCSLSLPVLGIHRHHRARAIFVTRENSSDRQISRSKGGKKGKREREITHDAESLADIAAHLQTLQTH